MSEFRGEFAGEIACDGSRRLDEATLCKAAMAGPGTFLNEAGQCQIACEYGGGGSQSAAELLSYSGIRVVFALNQAFAGIRT